MAEDKKITPVVKSGNVKTRKPNEASKFAKMFFSDDAGSTKDFVIEEVLVPKAKDLITSILKAIVDTVFYGRNGYSGGGKSRAESVSYRSYYDQPKSSKTYKSTPMFEEIIFSNPQEASEVCARMEEIIATYKIATYGDLYDLVGIKAPYTSENYGWTDFKSAKVVRTSDGYIIKTPQAMPVD